MVQDVGDVAGAVVVAVEAVVDRLSTQVATLTWARSLSHKTSEVPSFPLACSNPFASTGFV